jgi:hypothetical protein
MHFNHTEIMLIHQKYESEVVEGDPGSLPGKGVDVDGPGSEAVGTGEADRGLRYCIILVCLASAGAPSRFVLHRTESHNSEIFSHITSRWENFSLAYAELA